ncbi:MAG: hypothetical protein IPM46_04200 [Flavobacteriales bacterium]|nr:hypothetical protein [Flavobacteriales bacterium]
MDTHRRGTRMNAQQRPLPTLGQASGRQRPGIVVFCTHGIGDPLVETLMLDYLKRLQADPEAGDVLLFTEEPPGAPVPPDLTRRLAEAGIVWAPLGYNVDAAQWSQRWRNLLRMWRMTRAFALTHRNPWLIGHLSFGGAYAMVVAFLVRARTMVVCFEPHSRYMIELGIWPARSLKAWMMGWLERRQIRFSNALIVPTTAVRDLASSMRRRGSLDLQAITIDVGRACHDRAARTRLRLARGVADDEIVLMYAGKFGGIYHSIDQYMGFMCAVNAADTTVRWCVITQEAEIQRLQRHPLWPRVAERLILVPPVQAAHLHEWLSMGDIGVVAIPPSPSQAYRTPVKTAHYWAAGLPILIPRGVSDDHVIAANEGVGLVVDDLVGIDATALAERMHALLHGDRDHLRQQCMAAARRHRDTGLMVDLLRRLLSV